MAQDFNVYFNIKYGSDPCQFVNFYLPTGMIAGTIVRIHGDNWNSGITSPYPLINDTTQDVNVLASNGYAVVDVNYRGKNSTNGSNGNGKFPNNINDIKTVLRYCLVEGAGYNVNKYWKKIFDTQNNNRGIMVTGTGAGAHLALYSVCDYGTSTGIWPLSVYTIGGFFNLSYPDVFIDEILQQEINDYVTSITDLKLASPYYQYGSYENPGPWFSAVNNSPCKFNFLQNNYDTLTQNNIVLPTVENFKKNNPNTTVTIVSQGPGQANFIGNMSVTFKGQTSNGTVSTLPDSGNSLGDAYYCPDTFNSYWVYNQGIYSGDVINPASYRGFTRWFSHNYSS